MTNINPNNDVGKINNNIKKGNKVNKKKEVVAQQKQVEASALNALSSYGKANVHFKGNKECSFEEKKAELEQTLKEEKIPSSEISSILHAVKEETIPLAEKLCVTKDKWGGKLFNNRRVITEILRTVEPATLDFAEKICFSENQLYSGDIPLILKNTSEQNIKLAEKLCIGQNENGSQLLQDKYIIAEILRKTYDKPEEIIKFAENLCIGKDEHGKELFEQKKFIGLILNYTNEKNLPLAEKLCFSKDETGNDLFKNKGIIANILLNAKEDSFDITEEICLNNDFILSNNDDFDFTNIIYNTNKNNYKLYKKLIETGNYSKSDISNILQETKDAYLIIEDDKIYVDKDKQFSYSLEEFADFVLKIIANENFNWDERKHIINAFLQIKPKNLKDKTRALYLYKSLLSGDLIEKELLEKLDLEKKVKDIEKSIKHVITPIKISNEEAQTMFHGFFANNNPTIENILTTTNFEDYGKQGLPLEYSRKEFLKDLTNELKKLSPEEQIKILNKLDISLIEENDEIKGYNGIINLEELSTEGIEGKISNIATKFIKENKINTGDKEVDKTLNSLITGIPEFINIIGKQQHGTQDFSVDIHMLYVLKQAMKNPKYKELSDSNKIALKIATILHDIGKEEGIVDEGHASTSALYVRDILNKEGINLNQELKNRIYELVKNHHWLADYNKGERSAKYTASLFRRTQDLEIAQIMADADLKGVTKDGLFYDRYKDALEEDMQDPIKNTINKINATGQLFFTNRIINPQKIPIVEHKGKEYKVIDFTKLPKNTDLEQYGFEPNTTVDNLRLLVHTTDNLADIDNATHLEDSSNDGLICASYISIEKNSTYCGNLFGVSVDVEQANIANATPNNQSSGYEKTFDKFNEFITTEENRELIPNYIRNKLDLTHEEYAELFAKLQNKKHFSQLDNIKEIQIGTKSFTGKELKDVIQKANDEILSNKKHNELNLYAPRVNAIIAKVNTINEVPSVLLNFAEKNDYPIYLIGE